MKPIQIIVENWPSTDYLAVYIPVCISIIALAAALYSAKISRESLQLSTRPYVWALSYSRIVGETLHPEPALLAFKVMNAPARIVLSKLTVMVGDSPELVHTDRNIVRYPDTNSEWNFGIGMAEFDSLLAQHRTLGQPMKRVVEVTYAALGGTKIYTYRLTQNYIDSDGQWRDDGSFAT